MTWLAWLAAKSALGAPRWLLLLAVLAAIAGLWLALAASEAADDAHNQQIGGAIQREGDLRTTIQRTEEGHAARAQVEADVSRGGGAVLYDECLRTARTPANCQRFLPGGQAD